MRAVWGLLLLLLASPAFAQAPVQQSPTELRAAQTCNDQRATGANTATLTPPSGQFLYITSLEANAAAQAGTLAAFGTAASLTTTNIPVTVTFGVFPIQAQTAGVAVGSYFYTFGGSGLKTNAPGTATTVVAPSVTNLGWHLALCGYFAP